MQSPHIPTHIVRSRPRSGARLYAKTADARATRHARRKAGAAVPAEEIVGVGLEESASDETLAMTTLFERWLWLVVR